MTWNNLKGKIVPAKNKRKHAIACMSTHIHVHTGYMDMYIHVEICMHVFKKTTRIMQEQ